MYRFIDIFSWIIFSIIIVIFLPLTYKAKMSEESHANKLNKQGNRNKGKQKQQAQISLSRQEAGSNWQKALKEQQQSVISATGVSANDPLLPSKTVDSNEIKDNNSNQLNSNTNATSKKKTNKRHKNRIKYVAMDCEMVGIGPYGTDDMLARVSIVNRNGDVILDKYVKPREKVTNYRTSVSGIRPHDIENGEDFEKVQDEVVEILQDKILVGHAIKHDLRVLFIKHPFILIRDTANYRPLAKLVSNGRTPSLKRVAKVVLGIDIQEGEHSSVEDARAAMQVYNSLSVEWEKYIQKKAAHYNSRYNN